MIDRGKAPLYSLIVHRKLGNRNEIFMPGGRILLQGAGERVVQSVKAR